MARIGPLSNVKPIWDYGTDGYPSRVRLAMEDGKIVTFWRDIQQPEPVTDRGWTNIGYSVQGEYQPKHLKRPAVLRTPTGK